MGEEQEQSEREKVNENKTKEPHKGIGGSSPWLFCNHVFSGEKKGGERVRGKIMGTTVQIRKLRQKKTCKWSRRGWKRGEIRAAIAVIVWWSGWLGIPSSPRGREY